MQNGIAQEAVQALQGEWIITTSDQFEDLALSICDQRVEWADQKYPAEALGVDGDAVLINVNTLQSVTETVAKWLNTQTGEVLVWTRKRLAEGKKVQGLQGDWTITTSAHFEDLRVTISHLDVQWEDPAYPAESITLKGSGICINVNTLQSISKNEAKWLNTQTGEVLVWTRR